MNSFKYYLRDAREGIRRNAGAAAATILLIFISLSITGSLFVLKSSVDDVVAYLESQVKIKVFVDPSIGTERVAEILEAKSFVESVSIETKLQTLDRLKTFFDGKEHMFVAFQNSDLPDAIVVELKDKEQVSLIAKELKATDGVTEVVYAQKFAQNVLTWSNKINQYGSVILLVFISASFLTVSIAINLALYQRQKDIRVKLLLGAKESHVRGQFLFEGWLLGFIGSVLASFAIYLVYNFVLYRLTFSFSGIFQFSPFYLNASLVAVIIGGSLIGILGSYLSTRKLMRHA